MATKTIDEKQLRNQFDSSEGLRTEFANDFEAFKAFSLADAAGRIQISRSKSCGPVTAEQFHAEVRMEELNEKIAANESELERLSGLQKKNADDEASQNAAQYASGVSCQV